MHGHKFQIILPPCINVNMGIGLTELYMFLCFLAYLSSNILFGLFFIFYIFQFY